MVKSSKEQIQEDERNILAVLTKNSKENIDEIAKHCGCSKQKVWRIIKQLEAKSMIWGYTAIFNEEKMGLKHFTLLIKRTTKKLDEKTAEKVISRQLQDRSAEFEGATIESSAYVHGDYDWLVTFTAKDIMHAKRFTDSLVRLYPGNIEKIMILETLMFIRKQYILNPDKSKLKELI